ncbi:hypothetical protein GMA19_03594 [Paenibacillus polymyxa E681]|nr:hypothetical protein GE561_03596 [Paenibacillus polymyxa E681]QNV63258.1 hypothetical protein GMA19_03594 [Paenibacillus polymyxa E681]
MVLHKFEECYYVMTNSQQRYNMTTIKVTPEQLMAISKQFELAQQKAARMNYNLMQQISSMERFWDGVTKEQF